MPEVFNLLQQTPVHARGRKVVLSGELSYDQQYYVAHRHEILAEAKAKRDADREAYRQACRDQYARNREAILAKRRKAYAADPERFKAQANKHRAAYRERNRERLLAKEKLRNQDPKVKARKAAYLRQYRAKSAQSYIDQAVCPDTGQPFAVRRRLSSVGKPVRTRCICGKSHKHMLAGPALKEKEE